MNNTTIQAATAAPCEENLLPKAKSVPHIENHDGLLYERVAPYTLRNGSFRTKIGLCDPMNPKKLLSPKITVTAKTAEELEQKVNEVMAQLKEDHMDKLFEILRQHRSAGATLGLYRGLMRDYICEKKNWLKDSETYDALWNDLLKGSFETIPISELAFYNTTKDIMDTLFGHTRKKISKKEKLCWIQLSMFYDALVDDELLAINPIQKRASKLSRSITKEIFKRLSGRSLSSKELLCFIRLCLEIGDSSLKTCMLLHVLLGLTWYELCGLDMGAVVRSQQLCWLEIYQIYYQARGCEPELRQKLDSANRYRRVVLSHVIEHILKLHMKERRAAGAEKASPLFVVNGERLTPDHLKKVENLLIDQCVSKGIRTPIKKRGKNHATERELSRGDILRGTAAYFFKNVAKMTLSESAVTLGIDRIHTYAVWYVDWNNGELMETMKEKLSLWHNQFITIQNRNGAPASAAKTTQPLCNGISMLVRAKGIGSLVLKCLSGVKVSITEFPKPFTGGNHE